MRTICIIPARGGSKGIPDKNLVNLNNKPLISYSIELAKSVMSTEDICVSSDSHDIIEFSIRSGIKSEYIRPEELATDQADIHNVILDVITYYESRKQHYDALLLLQPTSPFRNKIDILNVFDLYGPETDMVVSVNRSSFHPDKCFLENSNGYLEKLTDNRITRRQDLINLFSYNGSIYLMNLSSLKREHFSKFRKVIKYEMDNFRSLDIDSHMDLAFAEFLINRGYIK